METVNQIGPILAIFLTVCVMSFLYRDNPFYKFAEHLFLGVSAGYWLVIELVTVLKPKLIEPMIDGAVVGTARWWLLFFPLVLGALMFTGYIKRYAWLATIPMSFIVGTYAGLNIIGSASSDLILQLQATMKPLIAQDAGGIRWLDTFSTWVVIGGVICCLFFFFFSRPHTGALGIMSKVGIWFLMISFGASFGFTVMGRISLAIGRAQEMLTVPVATVLSIVVVAGGLAIMEVMSRKTATAKPGV